MEKAAVDAQFIVRLPGHFHDSSQGLRFAQVSRSTGLDVQNAGCWLLESTVLFVMGVCRLAQVPFLGDPKCHLSRWVELQDHSPRCTFVQTPNGIYRTLPAVGGTLILISV